MPDNETIRNYVTSNLFVGEGSDLGGFSKTTDRHKNFMFHQICIVASAAITTGSYKVRMLMSSDENSLEFSVDTGKILAFNGGQSSTAHFAGAIKGIHLELISPLSNGKTMSCILTSSISPFDATGDVTE